MIYLESKVKLVAQCDNCNEVLKIINTDTINQDEYYAIFIKPCDCIKERIQYD